MNIFEQLFNFIKTLVEVVHNFINGLGNFMTMIKDYYAVFLNYVAYVPTFVWVSITFGIGLTIILWIFGRKFS